MIELRAGDYRLVLEPARGGSVARFDFGGEALLRPTCGPSVLDTGCFPLVPFSNRIAQGVFHAGGHPVRLTPNFPGAPHPHPLHGFGWLCDWQVIEAGPGHALLRHTYTAGEWPWDYVAEQGFDLSDQGLTHRLMVCNRGNTRMPAGLGLHPYFLRNAQTLLVARHCGEWQTAKDGIPVALQRVDQAVDWWQGQPVGDRVVDTVYTGREGEITIVWPDRGLRLDIAPSDNLPCTVVYTPADADFFCAEPVSHGTDAINHPDRADAMHWLAPGDVFAASVRYAASQIERA